MYLQSPLLYGVLAATAAAGAGIWLLLRGKKKPESERERERRLSVNTAGRMTDGVLTETLSCADPANPLLVFYRYSISGVEYSAAQDVSSLREILTPGNYLPGEAVTVKYDQHFPSNSIVVCERWNGLHRNVNSGSQRHHPDIS